MRMYVSFRAHVLLAMASLMACGPSAKRLAEATPTLQGTVATEAGTPLAGVAISMPGRNISTISDAAGHYVLHVTGAKLGEEAALLLVQPGYARMASRVRLGDLHVRLDFALRAYDAQMTLTLPGAGGAPLVVTPVSKGDGAITLTIPPASLVRPDGSVATGTATLRLTYWHPNQDLVSAPAPLTGVVGGNMDGQVDLISYGMADIELMQGDAHLQVVPGQKLGLRFGVPANLAATLANIDPQDLAAPHLWYADETTGLWAESGSLADLTLTANAAGTQVDAQLPHLSAWNLDGVAQTNLCVTGKVIDGCGKPVANQSLTLWLMGGGQIAQYTVQTGADGSYCSNLTGSAANGVKGPRLASFHVFVSDLKDPEASQCNPTGAATFSSLCTINRGPWCAGGDAFSNARNGPAVLDFTAGLKRCKVAETSVPLCGYCAGTEHPASCMASLSTGLQRTGPMVAGACGTLPDAVLPGCGLRVPPKQNVCGTIAAKKQGDACNQDVDCCPNDALVCADGLCVPAHD